VSIKTQGTVEEQFHTFFNSASDSGQWLFSQPVHFTPEERTDDLYLATQNIHKRQTYMLPGGI
jgi:hypothetical protein